MASHLTIEKRDLISQLQSLQASQTEIAQAPGPLAGHDQPRVATQPHGRRVLRRTSSSPA